MMPAVMGGDPPSGVPPEALSRSIEDAIANCKGSESGYVTCPVPPWDALGIFGRITTWPKDKEEVDRSTSCRCYYHTGCSSPAKFTKDCSQEFLLRWLLGGKIPAPGASTDRKREWGDMHKLAFTRSYRVEAASQPL